MSPPSKQPDDRDLPLHLQDPLLRDDEAFASWSEPTERLALVRSRGVFDAAVIGSVLIIFAIGAVAGPSPMGSLASSGRVAAALETAGGAAVHSSSVPRVTAAHSAQPKVALCGLAGSVRTVVTRVSSGHRGQL